MTIIIQKNWKQKNILRPNVNNFNKNIIEKNDEKNKNMAQMVLLNIKNQVFGINE